MLCKIKQWARFHHVGGTDVPDNNATVANTDRRETARPSTEDGGGAASAERKADRPVQLEPNCPTQPASPGV